jgi:hypothetical protein
MGMTVVEVLKTSDRTVFLGFGHGPTIEPVAGHVVEWVNYIMACRLQSWLLFESRRSAEMFDGPMPPKRAKKTRLPDISLTSSGILMIGCVARTIGIATLLSHILSVAIRTCDGIPAP